MQRAASIAVLVAASLLVLASPAPADKKKPSIIDVAVARAFQDAKVERI